MADRRSERAKDREIDRKFERQQIRLNRKWTKNALSGFILLVIILVALQFTPYRGIHAEIIDAAKDLIGRLTSGKSAPAEPSPKYW
jgi:hypothetical protein